MKRTFSILLMFGVIVLATGCTKEELNDVPVANAGPSQTIQLPAASFTLTGTGQDSDGEVVAYLWSQVEGPNNAIIINEGNASTAVTGFIAGNYLFQLMVTDDGGATGVDTVSIRVVTGQPITATLSVIETNEAVIARLGSGDFSNLIPPDWHISYWTNGGNNYVSRVAFKFDLASIPAGATIESAQLYLYSYPTPTLNGNYVDANSGSQNALHLQRITTAWTETGLNWNSQPTATTSGQLSIPHTAQSSQDLTLDVKDMVSQMASGENHGFLLKLQSETVLYNIRNFVSAGNTTHVAKRPKLVVTYK